MKRAMPAPGGRLGIWNQGAPLSFEMIVLENKVRPASVNFVDSFPPGGSL